MKKVLLTLALILLAAMPAAADSEAVIVRCGDACDRVADGIVALGGEISHRFETVDAVAASVPRTMRGRLLELPGVGKVFKDLEISQPLPEGVVDVAAESAAPITGDALDELLSELPENYLFNNALTGASELHDLGYAGAGTIVAVIDSGVVNRAGHALTGKVIGGENFVPGATEPSATSSLNGSHGTWAACMVAAEAAYLFSDAGTLGPSLKQHAPDSIFPCDGSICSLGLNIVPMIGTAPDAQLYALKVFAAAGGGSPTSRTLAAMERALLLKRNFNNGVPSVPVAGDGSEDDPFVYDSLDIRVVNMSLSGPTLYAAHEIDEELTVQMLAEGITLVGSAGNEGHAAMTQGGPGTGRGALTAAAASTVAHERILRDLQYGLGVGELYRPSEHLQTATFSSRGPTADGRVSTDATANGFASFAHGVGGCCSLVSGTSFSAPTIAGGAALLAGAVPTANAAEVRGALLGSANPGLLGDGSEEIEQGWGFIDLPAALALLDSGAVDTTLPTGTESASVSGNISSLGFKPITLGTSGYSTRLEDLMPGQVAHFFVVADDDTESLEIELSNLEPELPAAEQNLLFGDDLFVEVVDAPTSYDDLLISSFVNGDAAWVLPFPQTGLLRIAVMGDWTNAGRISADLTLKRERRKSPSAFAKGKVEQGDLAELTVTVPTGAPEITFELAWTNSWAAYPTDDLDLILVAPDGTVSYDGATLRSPERVVIDSPLDGDWLVLVQGFTVQGIHGSDASHWTLRVLDHKGRPIKTKGKA